MSQDSYALTGPTFYVCILYVLYLAWHFPVFWRSYCTHMFMNVYLYIYIYVYTVYVYVSIHRIVLHPLRLCTFIVTWINEILVAHILIPRVLDHPHYIIRVLGFQPSPVMIGLWQPGFSTISQPCLMTQSRMLHSHSPMIFQFYSINIYIYVHNDVCIYIYINV